MVSNDEFLRAIFGALADVSHVTAFRHDPSNIPPDQHLKAWKGDHYSRWHFEPDTNQYFTISTFHTDERGIARRRKALFRQTHCIVLDDVREKLSIEAAQRLPSPSWILETSPGSEQWGYILVQPCTDRGRVENLLDGLVANGLAPEGRDPGMKGVTRYVRLPEGINNKASKLVDGQPFKCRILSWQPFNTATLEALAEPFSVDLDAPRREARVDGAANVQGHPLLEVPDLIRIKEVRSDGRFDITCPWVEEHTGADDSGTAVFTNADGSIGFKCHHGACQSRTGRDLLALIERESPGFGSRFTNWKATRLLADVSEVSFLGEPVKQEPQGDSDGQQGKEGVSDALNQLMDKLRVAEPGEAREIVPDVLRVMEELPEIQRIDWHKQVRDVMHWNAAELKAILKELRESWKVSGISGYGRFDPYRYIYLAPRNEFYDIYSGMTLVPRGLDNKYVMDTGEEPASRLVLLSVPSDLAVADRLGWNPTTVEPPKRDEIIYEDEGQRMVNTWRGFALTPMDADVTPWIEHVRYLIPNEQEREALINYLAALVQRVGSKPSFAVVHRGFKRNGKDSLYAPVAMAMGRAAKEATIKDVLEGWGDHRFQTKLLIVTEVKKSQDHNVSNAMKTIIAPTTTGKQTLNLKGGQVVVQPDYMGVLMMTNHRNGFTIDHDDPRYFVVDSWVTPKEPEYYTGLYKWYQNGGAAAVLAYLMRRDISGFNHNALPFITDGAREMAQASRYDYEQDLEDMIIEGQPPFDKGVITAKALKAQCRLHNIRAGNNGLDTAMEQLGWKKVRGAKKVDGRTKATPTLYLSSEHGELTPGDLYDLYHTTSKTTLTPV